MAHYAEVPPQARGTLLIGGKDPAKNCWHYQLSATTGDLMLVRGPDTRDWAAIDRGALDYGRIAAQEHALPGFDGTHDGPKIQQACAVCNETPTPVWEIPTEVPEQTKARLAAEAAEAERLAKIAEEDNALKATLPSIDPEVAARDEKLQAAEAAIARAAELEERLAALEAPKPFVKGPVGSVKKVAAIAPDDL
jgi:hypothetical protein